MPNLENQPETPAVPSAEPWTPMPSGPPRAPACEPGPDRSEWRGTAVEAVRECTQRFEGTSVGFVRADAAGDRSAHAVAAEDLVASMQAVGARFGDAGAVYTVRDDGTIYNTVTSRAEYVPVCLA